MAAKELRVVLTVDDRGQAVAFYRNLLGLPQLADWSSDDGKVVLLDGGHAALELIEERQALLIDDVEVGQRVAGPVRLAPSTWTTPPPSPTRSSSPARNASAARAGRL
jgi:lactoylglutathione lyase